MAEKVIKPKEDIKNNTFIGGIEK
jgi:hypothetical protein